MLAYPFLTQKPFSLDTEAAQWVEWTLSKLTTYQKLGQLFCLIAMNGDEAEIDRILDVMEPGGIMYRPLPLEQAVHFARLLRERVPLPMLIAANLEKGGNGVIEEGTLMGSPMTVAATDEVGFATRLGTLCGREGAAVGANWAFAPIIDIDYNFHNPITNTRTFGSDPDRVRRMGRAYVEAVQKEGVAASIKHFPGDGVDGRDQHLLTSVNTLSAEEWDATFGRAYKESIDAGALTCMIGHIAQPAWSKKLNPALADEDILPASLSPEMMLGLLRGRLGFNGLIVTDATTMAGMTIPMPRKDAVPQSIAAGADMFLFTRNMAEDFGHMVRGYEEGIITPERLNEAVVRVLALKAALGLHKDRPLPTVENARAVVGCAEHRDWAAQCADRAITLVKEQKGVLPLSAQKTPRVLYYPIESAAGFAYSAKQGVCDRFKEMLEGEGFEVTTFEPQPLFEGAVPMERDFIAQYDLSIYLINMVTKSNQTTVRIEWQQPMGANCPHYSATIPTVAISVENPYHLQDIPRVKTYINAYNSTDATLAALMDKLTGRAPFKGKNPVDPFCGLWDTRL
ncbi:MAG: glycoside hydrolase family 3 protein [Clostridia bacterium]|nr:glycoside hydrolase family 3 protein [Clostridia bacterium]